MSPSRGIQSLPRTLHQTLTTHKGAVHVCRYAKASAKYILTGGQDRSIRLWNPSLGTEIKVYSGHGYEVLSITVCVCSNRYAVSTHQSLHKVRTITPNSPLLVGTDQSSFGTSPAGTSFVVSPGILARSMQSSSTMMPPCWPVDPLMPQCGCGTCGTTVASLRQDIIDPTQCAEPTSYSNA